MEVTTLSFSTNSNGDGWVTSPVHDHTVVNVVAIVPDPGRCPTFPTTTPSSEVLRCDPNRQARVHRWGTQHCIHLRDLLARLGVLMCSPPSPAPSSTAQFPSSVS